MKQRLTTILMLLLSLSAVACTQDTGTTAPVTVTDESTAQETQTEDAADQNTLPDDADACAFWFAATDGAGQVMQEIVDDFNAQDPAHPVRLTLFSDADTLYDEIQAAVALNSTPDITVLDMDNTRELYERNLTVSLSGIAGDESRLMRVLAAQGQTDDGTQYAVPFYGVTQVMFYNRDAFEQAGIDVSGLNTWKDLANAAAKLKQRRICDYGWELYWGYENMLDAVLSNGGTIFSEDGRTVAINTPEWTEVWEQFRVWIHEDGYMRLHAGGVGDEWLAYTRQDVQDGTAGGYTAFSGDRNDLVSSDIGIFRQPAWQEGQLAHPGARAYLFSVFQSADGARTEAAKQFVQYATGVSAQIKWATGTGFVPANTEIMKDDHYVNWQHNYPNASVPMRQCMNAVMYPEDPTGGEARRIMAQAADRLLIENIPAAQVLDDAQRDIQRALDQVTGPLPAEDEEAADVTAPDDTGTEEDDTEDTP